MKVPNSVEDVFIPMDIHEIDAVQKQRKKRDQYWRMLYHARQEFLVLTFQTWDDDPVSFFHYLKQNYGLQVETIDSQITGDYAIVDEKKYLLFLLKYGQ